MPKSSNPKTDQSSTAALAARAAAAASAGATAPADQTVPASYPFGRRQDHPTEPGSPNWHTSPHDSRRHDASTTQQRTLITAPSQSNYRHRLPLQQSFPRRRTSWNPFQVDFFAQPSPSSRPTTPRRPPASRLANPQNFSPRPPPDVPPLPSVPAVPSVPVSPPQDVAAFPQDENPLLSVPEQRRSRQSLQSLRTPGTSLIVEQSSSGDRSGSDIVALPKSQTKKGKEPVTRQPPTSDPQFGAQIEGREMPQSLDQKPESPFPIGHGDLENRSRTDLRLRNGSKVSLPMLPQEGHQQDGDAQDDDSLMEWGPMHPCYPHLNPHVPVNSALYAPTRIIRVPRDWMMMGDLAPTFANVYPEVLDGILAEDEFRKLVRHINEEVAAAFNPFGARAWIDSILGVATFWLWDDLGLTGVKKRLNSLESWIEWWNRETGAKEGVQLIPLRRTGYLTLDFQIPDPQIASDAMSRPGTNYTDSAMFQPPPSPYAHHDNMPPRVPVSA